MIEDVVVEMIEETTAETVTVADRQDPDHHPEVVAEETTTDLLEEAVVVIETEEDHPDPDQTTEDAELAAADLTIEEEAAAEMPVTPHNKEITITTTSLVHLETEATHLER